MSGSFRLVHDVPVRYLVPTDRIINNLPIIMDHVNASLRYVRVRLVGDHVVEVRLSRPEKRNAMNRRMWMEIGHVFADVLPYLPFARSAVLTGEGPVFSAGIDLASVVAEGGIGGSSSTDRSVGERACFIVREGRLWQKAWLSLRECPIPVVAAVGGGCFGAALELISFCDVRFCDDSCIFQAPEIDLGFAADIGANQAFPKLVGNDSFVREIMLSGRRFDSAEAQRVGFVSRVLPNRSRLREEAFEWFVVRSFHSRVCSRCGTSCERHLRTRRAESVARKSPIASRGVKTFLNFSREHSVDESLRFSLTWNASFLQTPDPLIAGTAFVSRTRPVFPNAPVPRAPRGATFPLIEEGDEGKKEKEEGQQAHSKL